MEDEMSQKENRAMEYDVSYCLFPVIINLLLQLLLLFFVCFFLFRGSQCANAECNILRRYLQTFAKRKVKHAGRNEMLISISIKKFDRLSLSLSRLVYECVCAVMKKFIGKFIESRQQNNDIVK